MKTESTTELLPNPPSLIRALKAGFDAVTQHLSLVLFPLILDLMMLYLPHIKLTSQINGVAARLEAFARQNSGVGSFSISLPDVDAWKSAAERINLLSVMRTYPVGIPSLFASRFPLAAPGLTPGSIEISSGLGVLLVLSGLILIGLVLGAYYFIAVSHAALAPEKDWLARLNRWPGAFLQVLLLTLFCAALLVGISIPAMCVLSGLILGGSGTLLQLGMLLYFAILLWIAFPLFLSPHGIFIYGDTMLASVRRSVRLTRLTLPSTSLLFLAIMMLSQGLDVIWGSAQDGSWMALVGAGGHAFIATALLASSFIYYREADQYVRLLLAQAKIKAARL